jgi:hypothetical protein
MELSMWLKRVKTSRASPQIARRDDANEQFLKRICSQCPKKGCNIRGR